MARRKHTTPKKAKQTASTSPSKKQKTIRFHKLESWLQSKTARAIMLVARPLIFCGAVIYLVMHNKGYERLYSYNFARTIEQMEQYKGLSYEQRHRKLLPQVFSFVDHILQKTPESAVILSPPAHIWKPKDRKLGFGQWMESENYLSYFLYPRRVIVDDAQGRQSPLMENVTHVLIVDNWGYDKLGYEVSNPPQHGVFPIKR